MTLPTSSSTQGLWPTVAPYVAPPVAAAIAIIPVFRDMIAKSAQQIGKPIPPTTALEGIKAGVRAAPTVGVIVGTQMVVQELLEKRLIGEKEKTLLSALFSSAIVGAASAPVLAVFNGQTMGWSLRTSLKRFAPKQVMAIAVQETAFVGGFSVADRLSAIMKQQFGDNRTVDCTAAFLAGALGSLAGHPANTAFTRWQSKMALESPRQLMWGASRKARAVGCFCMLYKLGKEALALGKPEEKRKAVPKSTET